MDYEAVSKVACPLLFRLRNDAEISAKLEAVFGRKVTSCMGDELEAIGGKHLLVVFWQNEIESNPRIADVAAHIGNLHSAPTRKFNGTRKKHAVKRSQSLVRPGGLLSWMIAQVTNEDACGPCSAHRSQMNEWGWFGCWIHRKQIVAWLIEEARKRGHAVPEGNALSLLKAAYVAAKQSRAPGQSGDS